MNATDQITADLNLLDAAGPMRAEKRQEYVRRIRRMREAEARAAKVTAAAKHDDLHRAVRAQLDAIRTHVNAGRTDPTSDHDVEIEEAMREIARLVG